MFFLRNKKKSSLNYPQYPLLSGALISSVTGVFHNRIMAPNIQEYLSLSDSNIIKHILSSSECHFPGAQELRLAWCTNDTVL